jgi:U-box domain
VEKGLLDIETFLTSDSTPSYFLDSITGVLFKQPIVFPSGKTVSKPISEAKPGIDIFSNIPFSAGEVSALL